MQVCLVLLWEGRRVSASVFGVVMGRTSCECKCVWCCYGKDVM